MKVSYIGTFNPITYGHLLIAETVYNKLSANVLFVPTSDLYVKDSLRTLANHRIKMIELSIKDNEHCSLDEVEIDSANKYQRQLKTIETLFALKDKYQEDIALLIGTDNFNTLDDWYQIEELINNFKIVVYPRLGYEIDLSKHKLYQKYPEQFIVLDTDLVTNISSTLIRNNFKEEKSNKYLLKDEVIKYIMSHQNDVDYWK